jgi:hypothetical protein
VDVALFESSEIHMAIEAFVEFDGYTRLATPLNRSVEAVGKSVLLSCRKCSHLLIAYRAL